MNDTLNGTDVCHQKGSFLFKINPDGKADLEHGLGIHVKKWRSNESECFWISHWQPQEDVYDQPARNRENGLLFKQNRDRSWELSADHFATIPLFWARDESGTLWCSNIFNLVASQAIPEKFDAAAFWEMLLFETPFGSRTLLENVRILQAATTLTVPPNASPEVRRYATLQFNQTKVSDPRKVANHAVDLLADAYRAQGGLPANTIFPMGGGLDSRWSLGVLSTLVDKDSIKPFTFGFSPRINEYRFAKLGCSAFGVPAPKFHRLNKHSYIQHNEMLSQRTGGLVGIGNAHCMDYLLCQPEFSSDDSLISNMFSDAICGFAAPEPSGDHNDISKTSYFKAVVKAKSNLSLPDDIAAQIFADLEAIGADFENSTTSSVQEYIYITERNTKFQLVMSDLWRAVLPVKTPFTQWAVAEFFLGLPPELRYQKRLVYEILEQEFPSLKNVGVVSSLDNKRGTNGVWWKNMEQSFVRKTNKLLTFYLRSPFGVVDRYATEDRKRLLFLNFRDQYMQAIENLRSSNILPDASCSALKDIQNTKEPILYQLMSNADVLERYKA